MTDRIVRIGGASAAINESPQGVRQFTRMDEPLDYMVFDCLAESVVGRLARQKLNDPQAGYARQFVDIMFGPYIAHALERGITVISNAGGLNPHACADALRQKAAAVGASPRIAVIEGDDLSGRIDELVDDASTEMFGGGSMRDAIDGADARLSFTAYIGALPIARALDLGADIVITGRIVDSATTLGALIHEFGWHADDFDRLAAGTLIGHLIECSTQVTGGTFTDWRDVPDWANIGYPIAECRADGSAILTKPRGTGGLVSVGTVTEQLLYEVQDVAAYIVPDVVCDFSDVAVREAGLNRVRVSGAKGRSRTATYKACMTYERGFRAVYSIPVIGQDAATKAERLADAVIERSTDLLRQHNLESFTATGREAVGAESAYGTRASDAARAVREVASRIVVDHPAAEGIALFLAEARASQMLVVGGTLPMTEQSFAVQHLRSMLIPKDRVRITLTYDGETEEIAVPTTGGFDAGAIDRVPPPMPDDPDAATAAVPLIRLAWVRSGDKGDLFNLGVIARRADYLPWIAAALTPAAVGAWYAESIGQPATQAVDVQFAPGLGALNFVVHDAIEGGLAASRRLDPAAKGNGQQLLDFPVAVPQPLADQLGAA